jgi:hypothetical protein
MMHAHGMMVHADGRIHSEIGAGTLKTRVLVHNRRRQRVTEGETDLDTLNIINLK